MNLLDAEPTGDSSRYLSVICGDAIDASAMALEILRSRGTDGFDLIYLDPPFNTDQDFTYKRRARSGTSSPEVAAFSDRWGRGDAEYLAMLTPRLEAAAHSLKPNGWLAVHVDWKTDYLVRSTLNDVFGGSEYWRNNIYWKRDPGGKGNKARTQQFPRNADTILLYNRATSGWFFQLPRVELSREQAAAYRLTDDDGRRFKAVDARNYSERKIAEFEEAGLVYRSSTGKVYKKYFLDEASSVIDMLWIDIPGFGVRTGSSEMTGYPTQKPIALLDRIVTSLCPPHGIVGDFFCGSGTTAVSALSNGRDAIVADISPLATEITAERVTNLAQAIDIEILELASAAHREPIPLRVAGRARLTGAGVQVTDLSVDFADAPGEQRDPGTDLNPPAPPGATPESLVQQLHVRATSSSRIERFGITSTADGFPDSLPVAELPEMAAVELVVVDILGEQHTTALNLEE